jgi:hypothetical protein
MGSTERTSQFDEERRQNLDADEESWSCTAAHGTRVYDHTHDSWLATTQDPLYVFSKIVIDWRFDHRDEDGGCWWRADGQVVEALALLAARTMKEGPLHHHHVEAEAKLTDVSATMDERLMPFDVIELLRAFLPSGKRQVVHLAAWEGQNNSMTAHAIKAKSQAFTLNDARWVTAGALGAESSAARSMGEVPAKKPQVAMATRSRSKATRHSSATDQPELVGTGHYRI